MQQVKGMLFDSLFGGLGGARVQSARGVNDENMGGATTMKGKQAIAAPVSRGFGKDITNNTNPSGPSKGVTKKPAIPVVTTKRTTTVAQPSAATKRATTTATTQTSAAPTTTRRTVLSTQSSGAIPVPAPTTRRVPTTQQPQPQQSSLQLQRPQVQQPQQLHQTTKHSSSTSSQLLQKPQTTLQQIQLQQQQQQLQQRIRQQQLQLYQQHSESEDEDSDEEEESEISINNNARHSSSDMEADAMEVDDMEVVNHQILSKLSVFATESDEEEVSEQDAFGEEVYDIDAFDMDEPRYMSEYINSIYDVLRELERAPGAVLDPNFLSKQKDVSPRHRGMVVDWLMEVSMKCVLRSDTIFLAIQLLDRFMHVRLVPRAKLQLIGATALFVASKFEETYSLPAEELANLSDGDFKKSHLLDMERVMLHSLKWNLTVPTSLLFLRRWGKAAHSDMHQHTLCKFIVELALSEYSIVRYLPSVQAASAVYLSRRMAKIQPSWTVTLTHYTGLSEEEVLPCSRELNKIVRTETTRDEPKAVVLKYRAPSFYKVATVPPLHDL